VGVEVLASEGEVLVAFQHRRVHEPLDGGGSSYRRSEPPTPVLLDATRQLMRALRYTGVGMVEFRVDMATGEWILVEINGRFWGSLPLAVAAGADFPAFLFDLLVDGRREFPQSFRNGLFARNWDRDFDWLVERASARRRGVSGLRSPLPILLGELPHIIAGRERSDTFVLDDPAPALAEVRSIADRLIGKFTRKLHSVAERLPIVRSLAARRALRAWRDARHVLFVCKGNICRSPYAASRAACVDSEGRKFRSAGYWPRDRRRTPAEGIEAARQLGIDLSQHRSARLDNASIAWADAIFVFDDENRKRVRSDFPEAAARVHLLGVVDGGSQTIEDPWAQSLDTFLSCYRRIDRSINRLTGHE
jgi:protein-tyrosine-phosphatase